MGEYKNVPQEINNVVSDNLKKLAQLFPSAVKDGQLDIDALKEELGTFEEVGKEKYEFTWSGKQNAKKIAQQDVFGKTLKFCPEKSKNADTTENIYIEGDNLEALKLLRQNYYNSIKMIYIDPPYNTGNDFVYNDDYSMSQEESDIAEGVVDELGERYTKNQKSSNKFHAKWLNEMYPRLKLAKDLLTDDGVIFISMDDNEIDNLKKLCNEIFGDENFIAQVIWERAYSPINLMKHFSPSHDYILCYAKNIESAICNGIPRSDEANERYSNPDDDPRGAWKPSDLSVGPAVQENIYPITTPSGRVVEPPAGRSWSLSRKAFRERLQDNRIWFGSSGDNVPAMKRFLSELRKTGVTPMTIWKYTEVDHSQGATQKLAKLFNGKKFFDYPKSVLLIERCLQLYTDKNCLILDFFSGSATTAHAVMQLNAEDGGNRKFIMVQLKEKTDEKSEAHKAGYNTICEIGEERIRRAGDKIKAENPDANIDIGFKVFEIANTNIKWNELELKDEQIDFDSLSDTPDQIDFKQGTKDIDVVYEIMLRQKNIPLSSKIEVLDEIGSRTYLYADSYLVCLETQVTNDMIDKLASLDPTPFKYIFRDSAFKDDIDLKTNAFRRLKAMVKKHAGATKKAYTVEFI